VADADGLAVVVMGNDERGLTFQKMLNGYYFMAATGMYWFKASTTMFVFFKNAEIMGHYRRILTAFALTNGLVLTADCRYVSTAVLSIDRCAIVRLDSME
jgi:hypothetical protein